MLGSLLFLRCTCTVAMQLGEPLIPKVDQYIIFILLLCMSLTLLLLLSFLPLLKSNYFLFGAKNGCFDLSIADLTYLGVQKVWPQFSSNHGLSLSLKPLNKVQFHFEKPRTSKITSLSNIRPNRSLLSSTMNDGLGTSSHFSFL